jgi:CheY-like chemotaxis protein
VTTQVLVVDDESVTRRVVTHALKILDIEVIGAADGFQALELAQAHLPVLAIVDINLPDMDGFEVMRQLRLLPHTRDMPVIIFTARNQEGDESAARKAGAADFLYKPFSTQELRDLIRLHLGRE